MVIKITNEFSASGPALGYFYQSRYSLYLLLNNPSNYSHISIERFDDVAFDNGGDPAELLQLKHHQNSTTTLTDSSSDLWRTIRVWSSAILNGEINPSEILFTLITTATALDGSVASKLRPVSASRNRDEEGALNILLSVANTSENISNKKFYDKFLELSLDEQRLLLKNMQVLDSSPNINDTKGHILRLLEFTTRPEYLEPLFQRLEGWWFQKVINQLNSLSCSSNTISFNELRSFIFDLQDQFHHDNLPIDFPRPSDDEKFELPQNNNIFIKQLELIMINEKRIHKAMSDYYRAYYQRSSWIQDGLIFPNEIENYEKNLVDEWERYFESMKECLEDDSTDSQKEKVGKNFFYSIDQKCDLYIRPKCTEPYVTRGSYHMLSDQLRIGWHVDFFKRLKHLISIAEESV